MFDLPMEPRKNISQLLLNEYCRWSRAAGQYKLITQHMNPRDTYETNSILERWYITTSDSFGNLRAHPATLKMREEFLEKQIFTGEKLEAIIDNIAGTENGSGPGPGPGFVSCDNELVNIQKKIHGEILRIGRFTKVLSAERMRILRQRAESLGTDDYLFAIALRYASLAPGGQQWSIPLQVAQILVEKYNVTIEGFASPFNSQILRIAGSPHEMARRGLQYYSLFPDLDSKFESSGNFFESEIVGRVSMINPPYIISIMNDVVTKCLNACDRAAARNPLQSTRMFIIVPKWDDAEFYTRLAGSKYLEKVLIHQPFQHFYEDANNSDKRIVANFAGAYFILTVGMPTGNYIDLEDAITNHREHARSRR